jgi:hypothetical protein
MTHVLYAAVSGKARLSHPFQGYADCAAPRSAVAMRLINVGNNTGNRTPAALTFAQTVCVGKKASPFHTDPVF